MSGAARRAGRESGQMSVEAAIMLPVLVVLAFVMANLSASRSEYPGDGNQMCVIAAFPRRPAREITRTSFVVPSCAWMSSPTSPRGISRP